MRELITYLIIAVIGFYVFPLFCSVETVADWFPTTINPIICFICSYSYGAVRPYGWWFPLILVALFVPTLYIYYHPSDWHYVIGYAGISFIASAIGWYIGKKREDKAFASFKNIRIFAPQKQRRGVSSSG